MGMERETRSISLLSPWSLLNFFKELWRDLAER